MMTLIDTFCVTVNSMQPVMLALHPIMMAVGLCSGQ